MEVPSGVLCPRRPGRALCRSPGPDRQAGVGTVGRGSRENELMPCIKCSVWEQARTQVCVLIGAENV